MIDINNFSMVETRFLNNTEIAASTSKMPYIVVDNFPQLGFLTALRFLEWVQQNPNGVISLPTGKTPEFFIKWTCNLLENWETDETTVLLDKYGIDTFKKPILSGLHFVQIDEFYPIPSNQHNSFNYYVTKYYIEGFGLDKSKALLINSDNIPLANGLPFTEVFPDSIVDLSLRYREPLNQFEEIQRQSIFLIDEWCSNYEQKVRALGGIGFFLGGIGPDGHIAFNTRGSDHHSTTRLTPTNFETQAVSASDLGGIEISKHRLVITIGLETITYNKDAVAIIFAAGESKASLVKAALESEPSNKYPATALQQLPASRFYLTPGAASLLDDKIEVYYNLGEWTPEKTERAVIDLCCKQEKYGHHLTIDDLKQDRFCSKIPNLSIQTVQQVIDSIQHKLAKGMKPECNQRYYHTGPHHDDIMLGILPHIHRLLHDESNVAHFSVLTSGFTAVTNHFLKRVLFDVIMMIDKGLIEMINYPDFFTEGYRLKTDKDVYHYLIKVASRDAFERRRGVSHRIVRSLVAIWGVMSKEELLLTLHSIIKTIDSSYDGEKNLPEIQKLKGAIREFEEELVWAHFGIPVKQIHHLRLGFYTGDLFTQQPEYARDVEPILNQLRTIDPTVISLAFDPEGSGPDTHFKVLQAIAEAVRIWGKEKDLSDLRIWGYRNVWYKFHPAEANVIVPVSLNAMATLEATFTDCYLSQVDASFPSYEHDGKFNELSQTIWVEQLKNIQLLLGKNFFYQHEIPQLRAAHGLLYFKEMNVEEFLESARQLNKLF